MSANSLVSEQETATVVDRSLAVMAPWSPDQGAAPARTIKSAERTLALFELFSHRQRPMTVGEIARDLRMPQPSVSMLVRNLTNMGYLERDRMARTYVPTVRIMLLGSWINRRFTEENHLERRLDDLMRKVGESVMLGIQNGIYCQYILGQMPANPDLFVQSGRFRPITCTATGRILLSLKTDNEVEAIVRRCNAEVDDDRLRVRPSEFMDMISQVRSQGYARTAGDMTPGRSVIAISVPCPLGRMPMAVGVGGLIDNIVAKEGEILAALREFQATGGNSGGQSALQM